MAAACFIVGQGAMLFLYFDDDARAREFLLRRLPSGHLLIDEREACRCTRQPYFASDSSALITEDFHEPLMLLPAADRC